MRAKSPISSSCEIRHPNLVAQHNDLVQKYNDEVKDRNKIVEKYNELAKQVEKQQNGSK